MSHLLKFEKVIPTSSQVNNLFVLLKKRTHSISHNVLPTESEHTKFVSENPYLAWYLIHKDNKLIGSAYLQSDNSIGLNFYEPNTQIISEAIAFIKKYHKPLSPIKSVRREDFFVNVASDDLVLISILQNLGKTEIQRTFCA